MCINKAFYLLGFGVDESDRFGGGKSLGHIVPVVIEKKLAVFRLVRKKVLVREPAVAALKLNPVIDGRPGFAFDIRLIVAVYVVVDGVADDNRAVELDRDDKEHKHRRREHRPLMGFKISQKPFHSAAPFAATLSISRRSAAFCSPISASSCCFSNISA